MKQLFLSITTLLFCLSTLAADDLVGDWCMFFDDFKTAMKITKDQQGDINVLQYTIGNESGEVHGAYEGYISQGATRLGQYMKSRMHRNAEIAFWGYFDYSIRNENGKRYLTINDFDTGHSEEYERCQIILPE